MNHREMSNPPSLFLSAPSADDGLSTTSPGEGSPAPDDDRDRVPIGGRIGRYRIDELLGEGGMGLVYAAYDDGLSRPVALKILRRELGSPRARLRLLREARALAQLAHPNVVTVYEVDEWGGEVFVAMELVRGQSLKEWLRGEHSLAATLEILEQAGRGLAAAHAAGIIHRDFKPANVLVGDDGRVRVLDFGLASASSLPSSELESKGALPRGSAPEAPLVTRIGAVMGTPAYMSPEQLLGHTVDPRSDQFAFCAVLYEAVCGVRPFPGKTIEERREQLPMAAPSVPRAAKIPARLRRAMLRGLDPLPERRHPSMAALLDQLHLPSRLTGRLGGAALLTALGVGAVLLSRPNAPPLDTCSGTAQVARAVWTQPRREAIAGGFGELPPSFADQAWPRLEARLDDYASRWTRLRAQACEQHPESALDIQLQAHQLTCLDQALVHFDALLAGLERPDEQALIHALDAAESLPPIDECASLEALVARPPPVALSPEDAAISSRLRARHGQALVALRLHQFSEGLTTSEALMLEAEALGHRPFESEVARTHANLLVGVGRYDDALLALERAVWTAEAAGDDDALGRALADMVRVLGGRLGRHGEATRLRPRVDALIERCGEHSEASFELLDASAMAEGHAGRPGRAVERSRRAVAVAEAVYGQDSAESHQARSHHAFNLAADGSTEAALALYERILADSGARLGDKHPLLADTWSNLGYVLANVRRFDEALHAMRQSVAIDPGPPNHPDTAVMHVNIAVMLSKLGDLDGSLEELQRSAAILEKALGPTHPSSLGVLHNIAGIYRRKQELERAKATFMRELELRRGLDEPDEPLLALVLVRIAEVELELGEVEDAAQHLEEAAAVRAQHPEGGPLDLDANLERARGLAMLEGEGPEDEAYALLRRARARYVEINPEGHAATIASIDARLPD